MIINYLILKFLDLLNFKNLVNLMLQQILC